MKRNNPFLDEPPRIIWRKLTKEEIKAFKKDFNTPPKLGVLQVEGSFPHISDVISNQIIQNHIKKNGNSNRKQTGYFLRR